MKAIVNNNELKKELAFISNVMKANTILPITESVKMSFSKDGYLTITGTDMETVAETKFLCESKKDFAFCIPFEYLNRITNVCVAPMRFEIVDKSLFINSDKSENIHPLNLDDNEMFPSTPKMEDGLTTFNADGTFFNYLSLAITFRSRVDTDVSFCGAFVHFMGDSLLVSGCNKIMGFGARCEIETQKRKAIIVPEKFCNLSKSFRESVVAVNNTHISAHYDNKKITCRLLDQNAADMPRLISGAKESNVQLDISEFKRLVNTSMVSSPVFSKSVSLIFEKNKMYVTSETTELNRKSTNEMDSEHSIMGMSISFQGEYLTHILSCAEKLGMTIGMSISECNKTVYLDTVGDPNVTFLLIPLFNNN